LGYAGHLNPEEEEPFPSSCEKAPYRGGGGKVVLVNWEMGAKKLISLESPAFLGEKEKKAQKSHVPGSRSSKGLRHTRLTE